MIKVKVAHTALYRNDEHFQKMMETKDLVNKFLNIKFKLEPLFGTFETYFRIEDEALKKIVKSAYTEDIEIADKRRDHSFRGMIDTTKAALNHFDEAIAAAARRVKVITGTFGNVTIKPFNEETSAIYNLLQELYDNYETEIEAIGLGPWLIKLENDNRDFDQLVKARNSENAARTHLKMKEVRRETDLAYLKLIEKINALIIVEGEADYIEFVNELNGFIEKYNNILAQRRGRYAAQREKEENPPATTDDTAEEDVEETPPEETDQPEEE